MYELALTLLALKSTEHYRARTEDLRRSIEKEVSRRLRGTAVLIPESHEYASPVADLPTAQQTAPPRDADPDAAAPTGPFSLSYRYMFYLPPVIGAFALLAGGGRLPLLARGGVTRTVALCTAPLMEGHGVVPQGRRWLSAVDHLWIYRFLGVYHSAPAKQLRLPRPRNVLAAIAGFAVLSGVGIWMAGWRGLVASVVAESLVGIPLLRRERIR